MYNQIIAAIKEILVEADYKTVEKKFISKGLDAPVVKNYIDMFKKLKDDHRISNVDQRNIDYWGKQDFEVFQKFVDKLSEKKSKTQTKKDIHKVAQKIDGAKLVAENKDWLVYWVYSYEAAKLLGTHNWCIVREQGHWDDYTTGNPSHYFYFCLSKTRPEDEYYKIAALRDNDQNETCYDFNDKEKDWDKLKTELNIPEFEMDTPPEYCDACRNEKDQCTCCPICGGDRDNCGCCYECEHREDKCTCCRECGSTDRSECGCWCNNCDEYMDDCNCCSYCDSTNKDRCGCCQECGSGDKNTCGCWCSECDELKRDCECERCDNCEELLDNCDCKRCDECNELIDVCIHNSKCGRCEKCEELKDKCTCDEETSEEPQSQVE